MTDRRIYDDERHAYFITYSCYRRRRLLDHDQPKRIVLGVLNQQMERREGICVGFVIMPDHVHSLVWFSEDHRLSEFMKQWKRLSSAQIRRFLEGTLTRYAEQLAAADPIWQAKYHSFNVFTATKMREKLEYMHSNPVRAGLVQRPCDWPWSSARYYEQGRSVGVPVQWIE